MQTWIWNPISPHNRTPEQLLYRIWVRTMVFSMGFVFCRRTFFNNNCKALATHTLGWSWSCHFINTNPVACQKRICSSCNCSVCVPTFLYRNKFYAFLILVIVLQMSMVSRSSKIKMLLSLVKFLGIRLDSTSRMFGRYNLTLKLEPLKAGR